MEMKQLEVFVCVAKTLSFSKAAEKLFISQPTVSASIGALEKHLGAQLFIRNTKEVSLTKDGLGFLAHAQRILSLRDQAVQSIAGEDRSAQGELDIIASTIPAQHLLPEMIASFQRLWPNILFRVEQADSRRVEHEMGSFRYDFGMVGTSPGDDRFVQHPIYNDELIVAIPGDAPESPDMIREGFADYVARTPFIMRESGSGTRAEVEALLSQIGVDPRALRFAAYFSDAHSILLAVSRGMGISLVSKVAAALYVEAGLLRAVEMNSPLFHRQIHLLHHKALWPSPVQKAFIHHAQQFYSGGNT